MRNRRNLCIVGHTFCDTALLSAEICFLNHRTCYSSSLLRSCGSEEALWWTKPARFWSHKEGVFHLISPQSKFIQFPKSSSSACRLEFSPVGLYQSHLVGLSFFCIAASLGFGHDMNMTWMTLNQIGELSGNVSVKLMWGKGSTLHPIDLAPQAGYIQSRNYIVLELDALPASLKRIMWYEVDERIPATSLALEHVSSSTGCCSNRVTGFLCKPTEAQNRSTSIVNLRFFFVPKS